ncbi:MAG: methylmalonyl-CoA mutase family protein, partial [Candidatus Nitrosocosmicus sp.]
MSEDTIKTDSGIPVKQFFSKKDIKNGYDSDPGSYPYLRGIHPTMYRQRLWTMRQYSGFGSA